MKLEGKRIIVDVERGRTVRGFKPRRLAGNQSSAPVQDSRPPSRDRDRDRVRDRDRDRGDRRHRDEGRKRSRERSYRSRSRSPKRRYDDHYRRDYRR